MAYPNPLTNPDVQPWDPDNWEPIRVGPTWATTEDGSSYVLPEYTLGWELAEFCAKWLHINDPETGELGPFVFTPEQLRFALWFYAHDAEGRFLYQRALLQRLKGWGKDPFAAALAIFEAIGPCRLDYIDEHGESHGRPLHDPYIQIAAVSLEQTRNTADMFRALLTQEAQDTFQANLGLEVQYFRGGLSQIHCVTSNPGPLEGKRPTFIICNETQEWVAATKGPEMYGKLKGNLIKRPLREQCHMLIIANAPVPGRASVSEALIEAYENTLAGKADDRDLLYDSLEAPANVPVDRDSIPAVIEQIRGDSVWIDPETVVGDFFDSLIPLSESRRKWFNQRTADSDSVYSRAQVLAARKDGDLRPGDEIVLGFDGGRTDDATALVAIRISDRLVVPIRIWEKPREAQEWVVPHEQVDSTVHDTFRRYRVRGFFADVNLWESFILSWSADYGETLTVRASGESAIGWDMRGVRKATAAHERLVHAFQNGKLFHNGDPVFMQHMSNTRKHFNVHGMSFAKEGRESAKKVDAYAATLLAYEALNVYLDRGRKSEKPERTGRVIMY